MRGRRRKGALGRRKYGSGEGRLGQKGDWEGGRMVELV